MADADDVDDVVDPLVEDEASELPSVAPPTPGSTKQPESATAAARHGIEASARIIDTRASIAPLVAVYATRRPAWNTAATSDDPAWYTRSR